MTGNGNTERELASLRLLKPSSVSRASPLRALRAGRTARACAAAVALLAAACAPHRDLPGPTPPDVETPAPPSPPSPPGPSDPLPRAVYIIHSDADYLYHDADGARKRADEEALRQAREAAMRPDAGEVLVFHQRTGAWRKLAGMRGGTFEHYRAGALIHEATYRRKDVGFESEAALMRSRTGNAASATRPPLRLAYFGHEITDLATFAQGLERLAKASGDAPISPDDATRAYELIVLSTCYGGTPETMRALAPLTDLVVASPAYLHLSYLDARALPRSDAGDSREARVLADTIARASFQRLQAHTTTEITVAVYDLREAVPPVVGTTEGAHAPRLASWDDCAQAADSWHGDEAARGVTLRYQPPRFGLHKDRTVRSAWQCRF